MSLTTADFVGIAICAALALILALILAYKSGWIGLPKRGKATRPLAVAAKPAAPSAQPVDLFEVAKAYVTAKRATEMRLDEALELASEAEAVRLAAQGFVDRRASELAPTILHKPVTITPPASTPPPGNMP